MKAAAIAYSLAGQFVGKTDTAIANCGQGNDGKIKADDTREFGALIFYLDEDAADVNSKEEVDSSDGNKLQGEAENKQKNEAKIDENLVTAEATAAQMTSAAQIMQASAMFLQSNDSDVKGDVLVSADADLTQVSNTASETAKAEVGVSDITSDTIAKTSPFSELVSETSSSETEAENVGIVPVSVNVNNADATNRANGEDGDIRYGSLRADSSGESIKSVSDENANAGSTSVFIERVLKSLQSRDTAGLNSDAVGENQNNNESASTNESKIASEISGVVSDFTTVTNEAVPATDNTEKSSAVQKAIDNFIHDFRGIETGESEIHITLEPESLGKLSIFMSQSEKGLYVEIRSDDLDICASLLGQVDSMVSAIQEHGIQIDSFDVRYMDSGASNYSSEGSGQRSGSYGREQPAYKSLAADDTAWLDNNSRKHILILHDYYYYYDAEAVESIEYRV